VVPGILVGIRGSGPAKVAEKNLKRGGEQVAQELCADMQKAGPLLVSQMWPYIKVMRWKEIHKTPVEVEGDEKNERHPYD